MADNVERIGLVFNEDGSTNFVKSLKLVNSTLKENYENFKLTQAQWDKTTSTTQKLRDKLVYLNDAYDIQTSKVTVLKTELEELEKSENRNEIAISKKRAQLTQAEASLQRYQNQIDEVNVKLTTGSEKIKEYGDKIEKTGNKINQAGNKLSAFSVASLAALTAATKGSIEFESAFAGVEKTVDATDEELAQLKKDIREMAKEIPSSTTEIAGVAEAAGQLGIKTKDIMSFTRTMIDLGNSTNLSAEEAATALAKFANVTKMSADEYSNLGSTIVALGNNFATTEKDIVEMSTRLAATGELTGLTQAQILALATAMSSVGIEAEAGGSAMSKLLKQIQTATELGGDKLEKFASVANMSAEDFKKAFKEDSVEALSAFISGLNDTERNGKSAIAILDDMGLSEVRLSNTILSLANSSDLMNDAVKLANKSWKDNNALNKEASKRYETLESKMKTSVNKLKDIGITVGNKVMPVVEKYLGKLDDWSKKFENLNDEQIETIVKFGAFVIAAGPALKIIGNITSGTGKLITTFGSLKEHLGMISLKAGGAGTALGGLGTIIENLVSPTGLAITGIAGLTAATVALSEKHKLISEDTKNLTTDVNSQVESWNKLKEATNKNLGDNSQEISNIQILKSELSKITDENGNIKKGYEERANFITNELSQATGIEISTINGTIEKYQELQSELDKVIAKKKAESILSAYTEQYTTAITQQEEAVKKLNEISEKLNDKKTRYNELVNSASTREERMELYNLRTEISELTDSYLTQMGLVSEYGYTIQNYEELNKACISGTAEEIEKAVSKMSTSYDTYATKQKMTLDQQLKTQDQYLKNLYSLLDDAQRKGDSNAEYILQNQITTAEKQRSELEKQLGLSNTTLENGFEEINQKLLKNASEGTKLYDENLGINLITGEKINSIINIVDKDSQGGEGSVPFAFGENAKAANEAVSNNLNISGIVDGELVSASTKIQGDTKVSEAANVLGSNTGTAFNNSVDGNTWGKDLIDEVIGGLKNKQKLNLLSIAAQGVAGVISKFIHFSLPEEGPLSDLDESMPDMIDLMVEGMKKNEGKLEDETKRLATSMKNNLNFTPNIRGFEGSNISSNSNVALEEVLYKAFLRALTNCKMSFDRDGLIKFIDNRLLEVM